MYDILILNGKVITGAGNPWFYGDIGIVKDKIVKIGRLPTEKANKIINAQGFFVSPGFIDSHSHSDLFLFIDPTSEQKIMQGITTENLGLDGMSVAPIERRLVADWRKYLSGLAGDPKIDWKWRTMFDEFQ